jgi:hypothetical protein
LLQRRRLQHFAAARLAVMLGVPGHDHFELRRTVPRRPGRSGA